MSDRLDNLLDLFMRDEVALAKHLVQAIHRIDVLERSQCKCGEGHHDPCGFCERELENAKAAEYNRGFNFGGLRRAEEIAEKLMGRGNRPTFLPVPLSRIAVADWIKREFLL